MISREYEKYAAELASRRCELSADELMELGKIGVYMSKLAFYFSLREIIFRIKCQEKNLI